MQLYNAVKKKALHMHAGGGGTLFMLVVRVFAKMINITGMIGLPVYVYVYCTSYTHTTAYRSAGRPKKHHEAQLRKDPAGHQINSRYINNINFQFLGIYDLELICNAACACPAGLHACMH